MTGVMRFVGIIVVGVIVLTVGGVVLGQLEDSGDSAPQVRPTVTSAATDPSPASPPPTETPTQPSPAVAAPTSSSELTVEPSSGSNSLIVPDVTRDE